MPSGYALTVWFSLRDSAAAQRFDDLVAHTIEGIRSEPGTLIYEVHTPVDQPLTRVFYELYADREAFQAHEDQAHTKRFLAAREEHLSSVNVTFLNEHPELSKTAVKPRGTEADPQGRAFGQRVQKYRKERGRTQIQLGVALGKTISWVSQVERGVQSVQHMDLLQRIADELGVSVEQLRPNAPTGSASPSGGPATLSLSRDLDATRRLLSGHPAIHTLLGSQTRTADEQPRDDFRTDVDDLWDLTHAGQLARVSTLAGDLLPQLEGAVRTADPDRGAELFLLLSRAYQALSAAFVRQDEADAAWVAADRAIFAAERSDEPLHVCASIFRMVHAFVLLRNLGQAEHAAQTAIEALEEREVRSPEALSVLGSLHLALAVVRARASARAEAREEIAKARTIAAEIGENRNDYNLEFGPVNVEIQAVSTAVDLGDAGEALDIGLAINAECLSLERQSRLLMDLGRAHAQRRHSGEALRCLLRAEGIAPETIQTHQAARAAIRELVLIAGPNVSRELLELAQRADALG